jgi:hypothetical protein
LAGGDRVYFGRHRLDRRILRDGFALRNPPIPSSAGPTQSEDAVRFSVRQNCEPTTREFQQGCSRSCCAMRKFLRWLCSQPSFFALQTHSSVCLCLFSAAGQSVPFFRRLQFNTVSSTKNWRVASPIAKRRAGPLTFFHHKRSVRTITDLPSSKCENDSLIGAAKRVPVASDGAAMLKNHLSVL